MTNLMSARARQLRRDKSDAETKLWSSLRDLNRNGTHFRQQAPIGPYVADFCDHGLKIVVEVDGAQHGESLQQASDERRTAWLNSQGYKVLRFWNRDVLTNPDGVMTEIMCAAGLLPAEGEQEAASVSTSATDPLRRLGEAKLRLDAGRVRVGGTPTADVLESPPPSLPRKGGGTALAIVAVAAASLGFVLATPAFAAEGIGGAVDPFVYRFMVFVMAIFVGYYVVWSVTPALHTPLMSVTNAISSVIVVGALLAVGVHTIMDGGWLAKIFGFLALVMASVNIFGGFMVTQRMLAMYKKKDAKK